MENRGLVSIITPAFNSSRFIRETIESILAQTYPYWELLITDDCSTDDTVEIVQQYVDRDQRIKLFRLERNSGAGVCRNRSIQEAQGRFIAFCDSDDCWINTKLDIQTKYMHDKRCTVSHGDVEFMDVNGKVVGIKKYKSIVSYKMMLIDCAVSLQTIMYDTKALGKFYMPKIRKRQDWGTWILLLRKANYSYGIGKVLARYRLVPSSISSNKLSLLKYNLKVYEEIVGFGKTKALLYFFFLFLPFHLFRKFQIMIDSYKYINRKKHSKYID